MACGYDNEWILAHKAEYRYWSEMYPDYMAAHPEEKHTLNAFVQRTRKLGLNRRYTPEQDDWLRENYPALGASEAYIQFGETFGLMKGFEGFKSHIKELGLRVSAQRQYEADRDNGERTNVPVGTISIRNHKQRNGKVVKENWIKVGDGTTGWMQLSHYLLGKPDKGQRIIHLDGNSLNDDPANLVVIDLCTCAMMSGNKFWSNNALVTKTGIEWCKLNLILKERNENGKDSKRKQQGHSTGKEAILCDDSE